MDSKGVFVSKKNRAECDYHKWALTTTDNSIQTIAVQRRIYLNMPLPDILTEEKLIIYLRISDVGKAGNFIFT